MYIQMNENQIDIQWETRKSEPFVPETQLQNLFWLPKVVYTFFVLSFNMKFSFLVYYIYFIF